jgi:hypothetical protein
VHADEGVVTLIDTERLDIVRTLTLKQKSGFMDQLFSLVPLAPRKASAKSPVVGATVTATFSADNSHLYLGGTDVKLNSGDDHSEQIGRGLSVVNLSDGTYEARAFERFEVGQIVSLENGQIYLTGLDWEAASKSDPPYVIARLDGTTLKPLAIRAFPIYVWFYVVPAA